MFPRLGAPPASARSATVRRSREQLPTGFVTVTLVGRQFLTVRLVAARDRSIDATSGRRNDVDAVTPSQPNLSTTGSRRLTISDLLARPPPDGPWQPALRVNDSVVSWPYAVPQVHTGAALSMHSHSSFVATRCRPPQRTLRLPETVYAYPQATEARPALFVHEAHGWG